VSYVNLQFSVVFHGDEEVSELELNFVKDELFS